MFKNNLIFTCGFGFNTNLPSRIMDQVKQLDRKPLSWFEVETAMALDKTIKPESIPNCLNFHQWTDPSLPEYPFSGAVEIVIPNSHVILAISEQFEKNDDVSLTTLRKDIWNLKDMEGRYWLDFEIRWEINRFVGRISALGRDMQPYR